MRKLFPVLALALALAMVGTGARAASTAVFTIPPGNYSGTIPIAATSIPTNASSALVTLDTSTATDPATGFTGTFEISYDGGANWLPLFSASYTGGSALLRDGGCCREWSLGESLDQAGNPNRMIRGQVVVTGIVPLATGGSLTVFQ